MADSCCIIWLNLSFYSCCIINIFYSHYNKGFVQNLDILAQYLTFFGSLKLLFLLLSGKIQVGTSESNMVTLPTTESMVGPENDTTYFFQTSVSSVSVLLALLLLLVVKYIMVPSITYAQLLLQAF